MTYLVFDIETVPNDDLLRSAEGMSAEEYRQSRETDFIPVSYVQPVSVAVGRVNRGYELESLVALEEAVAQTPTLFEACTEKALVEAFWDGWSRYNAKGNVTFVTFNGRRYDVPVMECAAFRHGVSIPQWFNTHAKSWDQNRNRYNVKSHFDIAEVLSAHGSFPISGGLNMLAKALGLPGKMGVCGSNVESMYRSGQHGDITQYCKCDVLDTYMVFLRMNVLMGNVTCRRERDLRKVAFQLASESGLMEYTEHADPM